MSKKQTNLGQRVHVYGSLEEAEKQFSHDVMVLGEELDDLLQDFDQGKAGLPARRAFSPDHLYRRGSAL